jgi:asparagine synthase (glutamine-hydrolysing)
MLSGGLDSSSIACLARDLLARQGSQRLQTYSLVFDDVPASDERTYIEAVLRQGQVESRLIRGDLESTFIRFGSEWFGEDANIAYNLFLENIVYRFAQQDGVRVMLDGIDGDNTVSHGLDYLRELAWTGQWDALVHEADGLLHTLYPNRSRESLIQYYGLAHLPQLLLRGRIPTLATHVDALSRVCGIPRRQLYARAAYSLRWFIPPAFHCMLRALRAKSRMSFTLLNTESARRTHMDEHILCEARRVLASVPTREVDGHLANVIQPLLTSAFELLYRLSLRYGIDVRFPFFDRQLVEFCLSLPPQQKIADGMTRLVVRRALDGVLPAKVQWRGDKSNVSHNLRRSLCLYDRPLIEQVTADDVGGISRYVDMDKLSGYARRLFAEDPKCDVLAIWRAVSLALNLAQLGSGKTEITITQHTLPAGIV